MTLYEYLGKIAEILNPEQSEELFQYFLHTFDDNGGFLRTRYCYLEKPLADFELFSEIETAIVTFSEPYKSDEKIKLYDDEYIPFTKLKLQIFMVDVSDEESFYQTSKWAAGVGFPYPIKVNISEEIFEDKGKFESVLNKRHILGKPRYKLNDYVRFRFDRGNKESSVCEGFIKIVDSYGTWEQSEEPSYDVEIEKDNERILCKHIRESSIFHRRKIK